MSDLLKTLKELEEKATPGPWSGTSNIPFYAVIDKPAPSLSKHDNERPNYWRIPDVELVLYIRNNLPEIIKALEDK